MPTPGVSKSKGAGDTLARVVDAPAVYGSAYAEREVALSDVHRQADLEPIEAGIFEGFDCDGFSNYGKELLAMWRAGDRLMDEEASDPAGEVDPTQGDGGPTREGFVPFRRALPLWQWFSHVRVVCLARRFLIRRACGHISCDELFLVRAYAS